MIDGARLGGHHGVSQARGARQHDDRDRGAVLLQTRPQTGPGDDEVDRSALDDSHRLVYRSGEDDAMAGAGESALQNGADCRFVGDAENRCRHDALARSRWAEMIAAE